MARKRLWLQPGQTGWNSAQQQHLNNWRDDRSCVLLKTGNLRFLEIWSRGQIIVQFVHARARLVSGVCLNKLSWSSWMGATNFGKGSSRRRRTRFFASCRRRPIWLGRRELKASGFFKRVGRLSKQNNLLCERQPVLQKTSYMPKKSTTADQEQLFCPSLSFPLPVHPFCLDRKRPACPGYPEWNSTNF